MQSRNVATAVNSLVYRYFVKIFNAKNIYVRWYFLSTDYLIFEINKFARKSGVIFPSNKIFRFWLFYEIYSNKIVNAETECCTNTIRQTNSTEPMRWCLSAAAQIDDWKGDENTIDAEANVQCLMLRIFYTRTERMNIHDGKDDDDDEKK